MKDEKTRAQILTLLNRHKSTISRGLVRNARLKGYRPKQAYLLAEERSLGTRNAVQINPKDWDKSLTCLHKKRSLEQLADQVGISDETIYRHVYAVKAAGGSLYRQLRYQKSRKKRYASDRDRRGQIVGRRQISERPTHTETPSQVGHWEGYTLIGAAHKVAVVTLVEHKSGYAVLAKVKNKTSDLVSNTILTKLKPLAPIVKR
jgi:IS30 family transposase